MSAIKMQGVTKIFGNFKANDNIDLEVEKGQIHALLGENGAGKSTLMNILYGIYQIDEGQIFVNDKPVSITSPQYAQSLKIGMVHQHFMLIDTFTIAQNIVLGKEPTKAGLLTLDESKNKLKELIDQYQFDLDVNEKVSNLTVGQKQRVEILKVLYSEAEILIFDEPTAVLTPSEVNKFLDILKKLKKDGKTIILITHKLYEIKAVADVCTVIRLGKTIKTVNVQDVDEKELATLMVGKELKLVVNEKKETKSNKVLELENINYTNEKGINKIKNLSLDIHSGKILGIAGVDNNGQKELVDIITGIIKVNSGEIKYYDEKGKLQQLTHKSVRDIKKELISCIPEDRLKDGLVLEYDLAQNSILVDYYKEQFSSLGFLKNKDINNYGEYICEKYDVRSGEGVKAKSGKLSGGNQQKLIVGRELERNCKIIIAFQPTRGVDVGAINFIHEKLIEQRDQGKAVVLISMELSEVMILSDDIAVIHDGEIVDTVNAANISREEVGLMMAGKRVK